MNQPTSPVFSRLLIWGAAAWLTVIAIEVNAAEPAITPLVRAHAHNDYLHARPLLDALEHGFCSAEADIHLVAGKLLVAHDRSNVHPERTLETLYLEPLRQRVRQNGGRVFRAGPAFTLLIDLKSPWITTYPVLRATLSDYAEMLTTFQGALIRSNAVTVILSGNRSREMFVIETERYAALDGELADIDSAEPPSHIPWVSANWARHFKWRGVGNFPPAESARLRDIVARAHQHGRSVRFWGAPDKPDFWQALYDAEVDLINTDDLAGLEKFLKSRASPSPPD